MTKNYPCKARIPNWVLLALMWCCLGTFAQVTYFSKSGTEQFARAASWGTHTDGSMSIWGISKVGNSSIFKIAALSNTPHSGISFARTNCGARWSLFVNADRMFFTRTVHIVESSEIQNSEPACLYPNGNGVAGNLPLSFEKLNALLI